MKRIVIPVDNEKLSEQFKQCSKYIIFEVYKEHIAKKTYESSDFRIKNNFINWLLQLDASDIIAYKIDNETLNELINTKINLFLGIRIDSPEALIENYLNGNLESDLQVLKSE